MTEKEMRKLNRAELLELLLVQTKETERLQKRLEKAESEITRRQLQIQEAGDLAHAVLDINGVMEAAQAAANQYLENILQMERDARARCDQIIQEAMEEAARIRADALDLLPDDNELIDAINDLLDDDFSGEEMIDEETSPEESSGCEVPAEE